MKMKKSIFALLFALLICITAVVPASAEEAGSRLMDQAALLSEVDQIQLEAKLDEISDRQQVDVVVATADSLDGYSPQEYAELINETFDFGYNKDKGAVILVLGMDERDWYIATTGYGITAITDAGREYMAEQFTDDLSDGNYMQAFTTYADLCDKFITQAKTGEPYDAGNLPKEPFPLVRNILIALGVGLVIALIVTGIMRGKMKSVRFQPAASSYVKQNSMNVTESRDMFLYRHIDRREKPKDNNSGGSSTHTSSSGTTYGGGGGKF